MTSNMICSKNQKMNKDQVDLVQKLQKIREEILKKEIVLPKNSLRMPSNLSSKEMYKKIQSNCLNSKVAVGQEFLKSEISGYQKFGKTASNKPTSCSLDELERKTNDLLNFTRKNADPETSYRKFKKDLVEKDYLMKKRVWSEKQAAFYQEIDEFGARQIDLKDLTINYSGGPSNKPEKVPDETSKQNSKGINSNDNIRLLFQDTNANKEKRSSSKEKYGEYAQTMVQLLEPPKRRFEFAGKPLSFNNFKVTNLHDDKDGRGDSKEQPAYENDERFVKLLDTLTPIYKPGSCESRVNSYETCPTETDTGDVGESDGEFDLDLNLEMRQILAELGDGDGDGDSIISMDSIFDLSPRISEVSEVSLNDITCDYEIIQMRSRFGNLHRRSATNTISL